MASYSITLLPWHWNDQHKQLYNRFRDKDDLDLFEELLRYLNAKNDPKLSRLPPDMIDKTIEVLKFILEEERDNDIDIAIDQARALGVIP